jgi:NADH-quinone oxidoreductase subunit J
MLAWVVLLLSVIFLLTSFVVLFSKRLVVIISSIGIGSVVLSIIFFIFGAPFAGGFELSVGAGLISVLFIIAMSVTRNPIDEIEES